MMFGLGLFFNPNRKFFSKNVPIVQIFKKKAQLPQMGRKSTLLIRRKKSTSG